MGLQKRKIEFDAEFFPHYYLCTYIPRSRGSDLLSQSLVHFKDGHSPHKQAWSECAVEELQKVPELKYSYVIRALGHSERTAANAPFSIHKLTTQVTKALRGTHSGNFLEKIRDTRKLSTSLLSKHQREVELLNVYRFESPARNPKHILIIDDILTTGTTIRAIIGAVLKVCPSVNISVFTLATTDYTDELNSRVELKGKNYVWQVDGWMRVAEDSPEYAATLEKLKQFIMNDSFG